MFAVLAVFRRSAMGGACADLLPGPIEIKPVRENAARQRERSIHRGKPCHAGNYEEVRLRG